MRLISIIFSLVLFLVALGLTLSNTQMTELGFYLLGDEATLSAPLVVFLLAFFVVGVVTGIVAGLPGRLSKRREVARLNRQIKQLQSVAEPVATPVTPQTESSTLNDATPRLAQ